MARRKSVLFLVVLLLLSCVAANVVDVLQQLVTLIEQDGPIDVFESETLPSLALSLSHTSLRTQVVEVREDNVYQVVLSKEKRRELKFIIASSSIVLKGLNGLEGTKAEAIFMHVIAQLEKFVDNKSYTSSAVTKLQELVHDKAHGYGHLFLSQPSSLSTKMTTTKQNGIKKKRKRLTAGLKYESITRGLTHAMQQFSSSIRWLAPDEYHSNLLYVVELSLIPYLRRAQFQLEPTNRFYDLLPFELSPVRSRVTIDGQSQWALWDTGAGQMFLSTADMSKKQGTDEALFLFGAKACRAARSDEAPSVSIGQYPMTIPVAYANLILDNDIPNQMDAYLSSTDTAADVNVNIGIASGLLETIQGELKTGDCISFIRKDDSGMIRFGEKCPTPTLFRPRIRSTGHPSGLFVLHGTAPGANDITNAVQLTVNRDGQQPLEIQNGGDPQYFTHTNIDGDVLQSAVHNLILDTGAGSMLGPAATVHRLHQIICEEASRFNGDSAECMQGYITGYHNGGQDLSQLPWNQKLPTWRDFSVSCDSLGSDLNRLPVIAFSIQGSPSAPYELHPRDYIVRFPIKDKSTVDSNAESTQDAAEVEERCVIAFLPLPNHAHIDLEDLFGTVDNQNSWLMGDTFFRGRHTIFEYDGHHLYSHVQLQSSS